MKRLAEKGMAFFVAQVEKTFGPMPEKLKIDCLKNDAQALMTASEWSREDVSAQLKNFNKPCLLYAGTRDPIFPQVKSFSAMLTNSRFIELEGLNHLQAFWQPNVIIHSVISFLSS